MLEWVEKSVFLKYSNVRYSKMKKLEVVCCPTLIKIGWILIMKFIFINWILRLRLCLALKFIIYYEYVEFFLVSSTLPLYLAHTEN